MAIKKKTVQPKNKPTVKPSENQSQIKTEPVVKTFSRAKTESKSIDFVFEKQNYIIMIVGVLVIILGYILMVGGGSEDPKVFNTDIFDFRRLTLAPIVIILGFVIEIFAIMKRPKTD